MSLSRRSKSWLIAGTLAGAATLTGTALLAAPIEEPAFEVVAEYDGWELREYAPRLEARVTVEAASYERAVNAGFRVLAAFIFGGNEAAESVAMTAPVSATRAKAAPEGDTNSSTKIAMTAPVGAVEADGAWTVSFTMPSKFSAQTLPRPKDGRIDVVEVGGGTWAAARFKGRAAPQHEAVRAELEARLQAQGLRATGSPEVAQYNPPWTPGPLRRNEVLIPVSR